MPYFGDVSYRGSIGGKSCEGTVIVEFLHSLVCIESQLAPFISAVPWVFSERSIDSSLVWCLPSRLCTASMRTGRSCYV